MNKILVGYVAITLAIILAILTSPFVDEQLGILATSLGF